MGGGCGLSGLQKLRRCAGSGEVGCSSKASVSRIPLIGIAAAGAVLAAVGSLHVLKSTKELSAGISRVMSGDYETKIDLPSVGPMRKPMREFNEMLDVLKQSASAREDYVYNVSHEFKTPLSYIQQFATLLQSDDLSEEEREEYVAGIVSGTRRLSNMVSSMLELTVVNSTDAPLEKHMYSLDEQLRQIVILFVPLMDQKGISYEGDLADVSICANENLLDEAWANIMSNAVKFTEGGGAIHVRLRARRNWAQVVISDTGLGMSEEALARAFERFYSDESTGQEGTGLGLPIAQAIIKRHGGSIDLRSALGVGTTCTVTLPLQ